MKKQLSNVVQLGLPHTSEAERVIIGTILATPSCLNYAKEKINPEYFFSPKNRLIMSAICSMILIDKPPEFTLVYNRLKESGDNLKIGDLEGLQEYLQFNSSPYYLDHWINEIKKYYHLRVVVETCQEIIGKSRAIADNHVSDFLQYAESKFLKLAEDNVTSGLVPVSQIVTQTLRDIELRMKNKSEMSGISSSLKDLDKITFGFQKSDLIILAARPAMGKTAFALNIAYDAFFNHKKRVAFFSLEMSNSQLMQRMIAMAAKVDAKKFRSGGFDENEFIRVYAELNKYHTNFLLFDDKPGITIQDVASNCRRAKREHGELDLVIIDYIQLMSGGTQKAFPNREREISTISVGLKNLAKELNCPVIALSQLNRGLESREDKRPRPSDLRDSGAIEQDADQIFFIYRDEVYNKESMDKGTAEIIVGKNRHGEIGTVKVAFIPQYTQFTNLAVGYSCP